MKSEISPISFPENKPMPEDLDDQGRCWFFFENESRWVLLKPEYITTVLAHYFLPHFCIHNMEGVKREFIEQQLRVDRKQLEVRLHDEDGQL